jgi:diaminopimelate epimerase
MMFAFTKMQGLGNDFVVFNAIDQRVELSADQIRLIADRRFGIGCDQVLLVESPRTPDTDFYYRIFNADGSEVEQCGNGARCFARFVRDHGLSNKDVLRVGTRAGDISLYLEAGGLVRVNMGVPVLDPARIPFIAESQATLYPIQAGGESLQIAAVSMGNPHAVLQVEDIATAPVDRLGPLLEGHDRFPRRVNVGFMAIRGRGHVALRVFERGAGETLACGSGACAAVVAGRLQELLDKEVTVSLPGGDLVISWAGNGDPVWMSGPAARVYEGRIEL